MPFFVFGSYKELGYLSISLKIFYKCIYRGVQFSSAGIENAKCVFNDSPGSSCQEKNMSRKVEK